MDGEHRLIPISALQHYLFCRRQCALIHLEQQWAENRYTAEGRVLHVRADRYVRERRRGVRTSTALPIASERLGLTGIADVVEFENGEQGQLVRPIEYKRGRPKEHRADEVQLCAQALCLEEMLQVDIAEGALYYGKTRRRKLVTFDDQLRALTQEVIEGTHDLLDGQVTPPAIYEAKRCDRCSLIDRCQPEVMGKRRSARAWLKRQVNE